MRTTMGARIELLSKLLLEIAAERAEDVNESHRLAHVALLRILRKDPDLERFPAIVRALRAELGWSVQAHADARHAAH